MQNQTPIDQVFSHREALLAILLTALRESDKFDQNSVIQSLFCISKDLLLQDEKSPEHIEELQNICEQLALFSTCLEDTRQIKKTLKFVQKLFFKVENLKYAMAQKGVFVQILKAIENKKKEVQSVIVDFLRESLVISKESSNQNERFSSLSDPGDGTQKTTFGQILSQVKNKVNEISSEYQQQLELDKLSTNPFAVREISNESQPFQQAENIDQIQPLTSDQIQNLLDSRESVRVSISQLQEEEQPNLRVLLFLRRSQFYSELVDKIKVCQVQDLGVYLNIAQLLFCFKTQFWAESEKQLLPNLKTRFMKSKPEEEIILLDTFQILLDWVQDTGSDNKIKDINLFGFVLNIVSLCNQHSNQLCQLLISKIKGLLMQNNANPVIFYKEQGFEWLKQINFTEESLDLTMYLLHILCDIENLCFDFVLSMSGTILKGEYNKDQAYIYTLLTRYFQDLIFRKHFYINKRLSQLVQNCTEVDLGAMHNDKILLLLTCIEFQLRIDRSTPCLIPMKLFSSKAIKALCESEYLQLQYLGTQLIKCAIHTNTLVNMEILQQIEGNRSKILKMIFVDRNNSHASEVRSRIAETDFLLVEYQKFKELVVTSQHEEAFLQFFEIAIIIMGSPILKQKLDKLLLEDRIELVESFVISKFTQKQQRIITQCLIEVYTENGIDDDDELLDIFTNEDIEAKVLIENSKIVQPIYKLRKQISAESLGLVAKKKQQNIFREVDYTLLQLLIIQASPETLIYFLQHIQILCSNAKNKRILIAGGFQVFLLKLVELSTKIPRQQHLYLKSIALDLYQYLLIEGCLVFDQEQMANYLMSPSIAQITSKVICSQQAPVVYSDQPLEIAPEQKQNGVFLKVNCVFEDEVVLFNTENGSELTLLLQREIDPTFKTVYKRYSLKYQGNQLELQSFVQLGLFEAEGWNHYLINNKFLYLNKQKTGLQVDSQLLQSGSQMLIETQDSNETRLVNIDYYVLDQSLKTKTFIVAFGQSLSYTIQNKTVSLNKDGFYSVTDSILSAKLVLQNKNSGQKTLAFLDQANSEESILEAVRILVALQTQNDWESTNEFYQIIQQKLLQMHAEGKKELLGYLLDLSFDKIDAHILVDPNEDRLPRFIPILVKPALLEFPISLLNQISGELGSYFLEMMQIVLKEDQNLYMFYQNFGISPFLNILEIVQENPRKLALYETTLCILEIIINGARLKILETSVLQEIVNFLLRVSFEEPSKIKTRISIDCFSVIMIHLIVDETNQLLPQLLDLDIERCFYSLLQSQSPEIRDYSFKIITLIMSKTSQVSIQFDLIFNLLILYEQKSNICMTIIEASCQKFENVNDLIDTEDTVVIQMMNRSSQGQRIVSQINQSNNSTKKPNLIVQEGFLECFFAGLSKVKNDVSRHMCVKYFISTIQAHSENFEKIFQTKGLLQKLLEHCYNYQQYVIGEGNFSAKKFYENYLFNKYLELTSLNQHPGYSTTEEDQNLNLNLSNKSEPGRTLSEFVPQTRSLDAVLEVITILLVRDIAFSEEDSKTYSILLAHPGNDDNFQLQIIQRILRHFNKQPKVTEKNVLFNLHKIFSNLPKLLTEKETVEQAVINLINEMAFKSTMEVRVQMKEIRLLELRDQLMINLIIKAYEQRSEFLIMRLSQFSFEALASKTIFSQKCCPELLTLLVYERSEQTALAKHFDDLKQKLINEIIQFNHNKCVVGLENMLLENEIPEKEKKFLLQKVQAQLEENKAQNEIFDSERVNRRSLLVAEDLEKSAVRQQRTQQMIKQTKSKLL